LAEKKGEFSIITGLIGLTISLIVLFLILIYFWKPFVLDNINDTICFSSVVIKTYSKTYGVGAVLEKAPVAGSGVPQVNSPFNLNCKTNSENVKTKEESKKVIAKEMANCWGRFGEGKFNFYGDIDYTGWFKDNDLCYVCSKISSENEIKVSNEEMAIYLRDNKPKPLLDKRTYLDYITGTGTRENQLVAGLQDLEITKDKSLFVLFIVNKKEGILNRIGRGAVTTVATAVIIANIPGIKYIPKPYTLIGGGLLAVGTGGANALLQSKGFNSLIIATDSEGVKELCTGYAR